MRPKKRFGICRSNQEFLKYIIFLETSASVTVTAAKVRSHEASFDVSPSKHPILNSYQKWKDHDDGISEPLVTLLRTSWIQQYNRYNIPLRYSDTSRP